MDLVPLRDNRLSIGDLIFQFYIIYTPNTTNFLLFKEENFVEVDNKLHSITIFADDK